MIKPAAALLCALAAASMLRAQATGPEADASSGGASAYRGLSLQQLMSLDVTSVLGTPEPVSQTPAAIQVVTGDEIARSGATSLPEALRLASSLEVNQENAYNWAISARGFDANLSNKLLVLVDGRAIYTPLYGGVLWNTQDMLLDDIDRIEVVSGPGGTLWGANAVNGVIDIVSKGAQDTQGLFVKQVNGSELQDQTAARYGGTLAPDIYYRVYAKYTDLGSEELPGGASAQDTQDMTQAGFRIDADPGSPDSFTLEGDAYHGSEDTLDVGEEEMDGNNLLGRWTHVVSDTADWSLQAYYDHTHLAQPFAASPPSPPYYTGFPAASLVDDLDTSDVTFQDHFTATTANQVVWGVEYRFTHESDQDISTVRFSPPVLDQNLFSAFAQDEIALAPTVKLTAGSKVEHNDYTGYELEPSLRLAWDPAPNQLVWAAVSRAVRTPSRYDRDLQVVSGLVNPPAPYQFPPTYLAGNPDFISETVLAYEAGYRAQVASDFSVSVSTYYNVYDHLRSTSETPTTPTYVFPYPIFWQNNLEGHTYGGEVSADWQVASWWRLHAGYDLLREMLYPRPGTTSLTGSTFETADPEHQASFRSSWDLPHRLKLDADVRYVDTLVVSEGATDGMQVGIVPAYWDADSRLAWEATSQLELSLVGQNLLHPSHPEAGFPGAGQEEIERAVYGEATWRF